MTAILVTKYELYGNIWLQEFLNFRLTSQSIEVQYHNSGAKCFYEREYA